MERGSPVRPLCRPCSEAIWPDRLNELKAALAGRYEIEKELGHGGMAMVYLADDVRHRRLE